MLILAINDMSDREASEEFTWQRLTIVLKIVLSERAEIIEVKDEFNSLLTFKSTHLIAKITNSPVDWRAISLDKESKLLIMSISVRIFRVDRTIRKVLRIDEKTITAQNIEITCNEVSINIF